MFNDLRFALRMLRKNPGFTTVAVLTLALGIGANTAVFSLLEALVLRALPYPQPDRLFMLWTLDAKYHRGMNSSYPDFRDWQAQSQSFEGMAAYHLGSSNLTGEKEPDRVNTLSVTPGLFEVLGIQPFMGRTLSEKDEERVVLLSHRLWMRRFGGDSSIVGKGIQLDGQAYTVLGVLPLAFNFPPKRWGKAPELFIPITPNRDRTSWYLGVIGRLKPDTSLEQAQAQMNTIATRLEQAYPATHRGQGICVDPLHRSVVEGAKPIVLTLLGAVSFVLLIACANVANLLLARGEARRREIAIRLALGASRWRVLRQLLTESILLSGIGGSLGLALVFYCLPLLTAVAPSGRWHFTRLEDTGVHLNSTVLAFIAGLSILCGFLFGVLPAWKSTRPIGSSTRSLRTGRMRGVLVMLEVSISFVLLAGAGLMMKSLWRLLEVNPGFRTEKLLTINVSLPEAKYREDNQKIAFFRGVLQHLQAIPGVLSAGAVVDLPLTTAYSLNTVDIEASPPKEGSATYNPVNPDYFATMGISLIHGRSFTEADSESAAAVAVVNRTMAEKYWGGENPIGKAILVNRGFVERTAEGTHLRFMKQRCEIVGVVGDVRHRGLDVEPWPELYMPYPQRPSDEMTLILRTSANPAVIVPAARRAIWMVDRDQPVTDIRTMDQLISEDTAERRFVLLLISAFALMAVTMAGAGIYGVVSYSVAQRTHEIGIRMTLGAQSRDVIGLVLGQGIALLGTGIVIGIGGAWSLTRLLSSYLYTVKPTDPATFVVAAMVLAALALAANVIPARRATRVDPAVALRYE